MEMIEADYKEQVVTSITLNLGMLQSRAMRCNMHTNKCPTNDKSPTSRHTTIKQDQQR